MENKSSPSLNLVPFFRMMLDCNLPWTSLDKLINLPAITLPELLTLIGVNSLIKYFAGVYFLDSIESIDIDFFARISSKKFEDALAYMFD